MQVPGGDLEYGLSELDRCTVQAFATMIQGPLTDAVEFCQHVLDDGYMKLLSKATVFPLSQVIPGYIRRKTLTYLQRKGFTDERWVKDRVTQLYRCLDTLLGDKTFFFSEDAPGSLDALFYGHAVKALHQKLLKQRLDKFPRLGRLFRRITLTFFPDKRFLLGLEKLPKDMLESLEVSPMEEAPCEIRVVNDNVFEQEWDKQRRKSRRAHSGSGKDSMIQKAEKYLPTVFFVSFIGMALVLTRRGMSAES
eukprot:gb/GECG01002784.1/.p1 GENE.gb/GECG01002784.1/~~gb/GECG01002784.1/.p1  ORF type:complete len:250 (+),score=18.66 gb/GECG01002784.1/:1-750(+)